MSEINFGLNRHSRVQLLFIILLTSCLGSTSYSSTGSMNPMHIAKEVSLDTNRVDSLIEMNERQSLEVEFWDSHLKVIQEDLTKMEQEIRNLKKKYQKLGKLIPQEQILYAKYRKIISLFENSDRRSDHNIYHEKLADAVLAYGKQKLNNYNQLDLSEKEEQLENYISCIEELYPLYPALIKLEEEMEFLDEAFTKKVLNPYTMTDMDERRKNNIFELFEEVILPYLVNDLQENIACQTVPQKINNFEVFYERLLELRDADTKELELQLKEMESPADLIELFELKFELEE